MPRIARFLKEDEKAVYHVISRTALDGLPFKNTDKEYLLGLIKKWSKIFSVDVLSRLQKVNFSVRGQANERCDDCNHLKSLAVRLSPLAVICEFRLFAGDSLIPPHRRSTS